MLFLFWKIKKRDFRFQVCVGGKIKNKTITTKHHKIIDAAVLDYDLRL